MKTIYKPKGKAGEYAKYACNFYTGCSNDCEYCYCKRGVMAHVWNNTPHLCKKFKSETDAYWKFQEDVDGNLDKLRKGGIFFSFTTDPCVYQTFTLTRLAADYATYRYIPVYILTKDAFLITQWLENRISHGNLAIGFTLTGHNEMERHASMNEARINAMRKIHQMGYKTFASIEPVIDFPHAKDMIMQTIDFCDLYKVGLRSGVKKDYYDDEEIKDFFGWLTGLENGCRVYLKDSFLERLPNVSRQDLKDHKVFVEADYDIFYKYD